MRIASSIFALSVLSSTFLLSSSGLVEGRLDDVDKNGDGTTGTVIQKQRVLKKSKTKTKKPKKKVNKKQKNKKNGTSKPTGKPTGKPTDSPTAKPTDPPTDSPSDPPTGSPTTTPPLSDGMLKQPLVIRAGDGEQIKLTLKEADHSTVAATAFHSRLIDGTLPGPTIVVKRGTTLKVNLVNGLADPGTCVPLDNGFSCADITNLHYHGGHVSGNEPSDDVYIKIYPGGDNFYNYSTYFPENHMPGTHWIHPHVHGATTIQVGGGGAQALIVEDDPAFIPLPDEVANAKDVLLLVQNFNMNADSPFMEAINAVNDTLVDIQPLDEVGESFRLVNGQYRPTLMVVPGTWTRMRLLYAGWDGTLLDFWIDTNECDTYLLAKDGIFLTDYPRDFTKAPLPAGGRADIMVRCNTEGTFTARHFPESDEYPTGEPLLTIESKLPPTMTEIKIAEGPTQGFTFKRPDYLVDVQEAEVDTGCNCSTKFSFGTPELSASEIRGVNSIAFEKHKYVHSIGFGKVVERKMATVSVHPYHQHVYPFQISSGFDTTDSASTQDGYWMPGDWHDTLQTNNEGTVYMKYRANVHMGKVMLHCHRLDHEDKGMMSQEYIEENGECTCDYAFNGGEPFVI